MKPQAKSALSIDEDTVWHHAETRHFVYHFMSAGGAMESYLEDAETAAHRHAFRLRCVKKRLRPAPAAPAIRVPV